MNAMPEAIEKRKINIGNQRQPRWYLPVSARVLWFRMVYPSGGIETEAITIDTEKGYAIFRARVTAPDGSLLSTATKREDVSHFPDNLEKAEAGAVGRALSYAGFGTDDLGEDEIVENREAPVAARQVDGSVAGRAYVAPPPSPPPAEPEKSHTLDELKVLARERLFHGDGAEAPDEVVLDFFWRAIQHDLGRKFTPNILANWPTNERQVNESYKVLEARKA